VNGRFLSNVFSRFFRDELLAFLKRYGVETIVKYGGKIYPASENAREIVRVFLSYLEENGRYAAAGYASKPHSSEGRKGSGGSDAH